MQKAVYFSGTNTSLDSYGRILLELTLAFVIHCYDYVGWNSNVTCLLFSAYTPLPPEGREVRDNGYPSLSSNARKLHNYPEYGEDTHSLSSIRPEFLFHKKQDSSFVQRRNRNFSHRLHWCGYYQEKGNSLPGKQHFILNFRSLRQKLGAAWNGSLPSFPTPSLVLILLYPHPLSVGPELMLLQPPPSTLEDETELAGQRVGKEGSIYRRGPGCPREVRTCFYMMQGN